MNIYGIAEKCGVSIATVSRVLNDSPNVRPATREKILQAMREADYTPSALARGLGSGSTRMVGVLCTDVRDAFYAEALGYIEEHLRRQGMNVVLRCTGSADEDKNAAITDIVRQNVDAVILIGSAFRGEDTSAVAAAAGQKPVILINGELDLPGVYSVRCDERQAVSDVVNEMSRRGRQRILLLHDAMTYSCQQKIAGYRDGCRRCGLTVDDARIVQVERTPEAVNDCVKRLLVRGVSFDAVIGSEDILAIGAQKALQRIGLGMPVVGFNNSPLARCCSPELTTVDNRVEELCAAALTVLDGLMKKEEAAVHTVIPAKLIERESFRLN